MSRTLVSDLEAQATEKKDNLLLSGRTDTEYGISTGTKLAYLGIYFLLNVSLTIYNKAVLGKFAYPWLLTALHTGSASIGCYILMLWRTFTLTRLSNRDNLILITFSFLFTINIAISNVSLSMVSIPFHQIMRSTCPVFTVLIYRFRYHRAYSSMTYLSLVPIVIGVGIATYGDYYFTLPGFFLTLLGVILASIKTVATNRVMTGPLSLSPLEFLFRMSPLAFAQSLIYAYLTGEISTFSLTATSLSKFDLKIPSSVNRGIVVLAINGLLAFLLNISSFSTNKNAGALTMTVCGNVKQCLTILLGIMVFGVKVGLLNGIGMVGALAGAAWYGVVELGAKGKK
ncbi:TPT-domain-containing protein [Stipitochalara longipes BDJ]|nr:TPT-domain-containing protein [Stipitochalara longipes BDJ]